MCVVWVWCSLQEYGIDFDTLMGFKLGAGRSAVLSLQVAESSTGAEMSADSVLIGSQGSSLSVEDSWAVFARVG